MSAITACPHCSGTTGFTYIMTVQHHMIGSWGESAECGDSKKTIDSLAKCADCGKKMTRKRAEGEKS